MFVCCLSKKAQGSGAQGTGGCEHHNADHPLPARTSQKAAPSV
jgi:hypothetical protein